MFLELRVGEPADPAWAISHFSDSSQETPIFKEPLKAFLPVSWVFTAKQRLPLWPLPYSDLPCWDVLVKLTLRSVSQILFRGRETNVPGSRLKASVPVGCVNGLARHSCSSGTLTSPGSLPPQRQPLYSLVLGLLCPWALLHLCLLAPRPSSHPPLIMTNRW